jgi:hypothetical protein
VLADASAYAFVLVQRDAKGIGLLCMQQGSVECVMQSHMANVSASALAKGQCSAEGAAALRK